MPAPNVALLMITCLADVIRPQVGQAVVSILRRLGLRVEFPSAQTCCGQPLFNSGYADLARQQARHTIDVFDGVADVVTPSGSCAAMVKIEFPKLFEPGDPWRARAEQLARRTFEFSDYLVNRLGVVDLGAQYQGTVAYHYACHLRLLGLAQEAERLLERVAGVTLVPLARQDQCCGFGGSFAVRYPSISGSLVGDKADCIVRTNADTLVSTDTGCLMNIGGRLHRAGSPLRVLHLAELLDHR